MGRKSIGNVRARRAKGTRPTKRYGVHKDLDVTNAEEFLRLIAPREKPWADAPDEWIFRGHSNTRFGGRSTWSAFLNEGRGLGRPMGRYVNSSAAFRLEQAKDFLPATAAIAELRLVPSCSFPSRPSPTRVAEARSAGEYVTGRLVTLIELPGLLPVPQPRLRFHLAKCAVDGRDDQVDSLLLGRCAHLDEGARGVRCCSRRLSTLVAELDAEGRSPPA